MTTQRLQPLSCPFLYPPSFQIARSIRPQTRYASAQLRTRPRARTKREVAQDPATIPESQFPHDVGLFPGTFIMPTQKPSLIFQPRLRARLEWHRLKKRVYDFRSVLGYKFGSTDTPRPKLEIRKVVSTALALHQRMYTAAAEGDKKLLKEICCEGLFNQLSNRIDLRPSNESARWTLHRHIGASRVVSSRATGLPRNNTVLRQVVVRIKSIQSLARLKRKGAGQREAMDGPETPREMLEYLVLQRRVFDGKEGHWKVWGTTEETRSDEVLGNVKREQTADEAVAM